MLPFVLAIQYKRDNMQISCPKLGIEVKEPQDALVNFTFPTLHNVHIETSVLCRRIGTPLLLSHGEVGNAQQEMLSKAIPFFKDYTVLKKSNLEVNGRIASRLLFTMTQKTGKQEYLTILNLVTAVAVSKQMLALVISAYVVTRKRQTKVDNMDKWVYQVHDSIQFS